MSKKTPCFFVVLQYVDGVQRNLVRLSPPSWVPYTNGSNLHLLAGCHLSITDSRLQWNGSGPEVWDLLCSYRLKKGKQCKDQKICHHQLVTQKDRDLVKTKSGLKSGMQIDRIYTPVI